MDSAREWSSIVKFYEDMSNIKWHNHMFKLVKKLEDAGYVEAGLCGSTSMFDLVLGTSRNIYNNPRLIIKAIPKNDSFEIIYETGPMNLINNNPWKIEVSSEDLIERVERLLIKRLRWFKNARKLG